jgi:hypothetical protein
MCITICWQVHITDKIRFIEENFEPVEPTAEEWEINFIYTKLMMVSWMYDNGYSESQVNNLLDYVNDL